MKLIKILLIPLLLVFFSCDIISFEKLKIECNLQEEISYFEDDDITLKFSIIPNYKNVEDSVQLSMSGTTVECDFSWKDNSCFIKPKNGWNFGNLYEFTFSNSLQMEDKRSYKANIKRFFYYGKEANYLKLESCSIKMDTIVKKNTSLDFTFNKAVDILSFNKNFSITPSISYTTFFSDNNKKISIIPNDGWQTNAYYSWNLENIKSSDKYPLIKPYTQSFYAQKDNEQPKILLTCPVIKNNSIYTLKKEKSMDEMNIDNHIGLIFSESIDFDSLKEAISISPNVNGYLIRNDTEEKEFIFHIMEPLNSEKEYQLKISKSLIDKNNITMFDDYVVYFTPSVSFFRIDKILINENEINKSNEAVNTITIPTDEDNLNIKFQINKNISDEYKNILIENINIKSYFPSTTLSPSITSIQWLNDNTIQIVYNSFSRNTSSITYYYQIDVSGGVNIVLDEFGNFLEDKICVYFTVQ